MSYYNSKNKSFRTWLHFIEQKTKLLSAIRPGHSRSRCLGPYDILIAITAINAWETGSKFDPLSLIPQQHTLKGASHQRKKRANSMFGLHASVHSVCPVSRKTWNRITLNVMSLLLKLMTFKRPQKKKINNNKK